MPHVPLSKLRAESRQETEEQNVTKPSENNLNTNNAHGRELNDEIEVHETENINSDVEDAPATFQYDQMEMPSGSGQQGTRKESTKHSGIIHKLKQLKNKKYRTRRNRSRVTFDHGRNETSDTEEDSGDDIRLLPRTERLYSSPV